MHDEREWQPVDQSWAADDEDDADDGIEWVPVELPWDDEDEEELEWDARGWDAEPLFGDRRVRGTPMYPVPYGEPAPAAPRREGERRHRSKTKTQKDPGQLTKRRRKKLRAWDLDDEG